MRTTLLSLALLALPLSVSAQDSVFDIPETQQLTFADVGIAALSRETYVGSGKSETGVLPFVNAQYKGRYFVNPALGVGAYAIRNESFRLGGSLHYNIGRDGVDTPLNNEIFDVNGGIDGKISSRIYTPFAAIDIIGSAPLSGDLDGFRVDTIVSTEFHLFADKLRVTPGIRATFHSDEYLDSLYGITGAQLAAASLPANSPITPISFDSEVSTLGAHTAAYFDLNDDYQIVGVLNYSRLIGDVGETTLAPKKDGLTVAIALARTF